MAERAALARHATAMTLGLRRLDLAPYLGTTAIVVRRGSRISNSTFRRWGEPPASGIMRAVSGYLSAAQTVAAVDVAPWPVGSAHDYLVQLHIDQFEGVAPDDSSATTGAAHLTVAWEIIRGADGALLARGRTERREAGWTIGDYRGLVARLEIALNGLSSELTTCLARLSPLLPTTASTDAIRVVDCHR